MQDSLEKSYAEIFYGWFWFGCVKQTDLLSILLLSVNVYDGHIFQNN